MAPEAAYTVNLAIDGLLSNTIGHGYDDEAHRIMVNVRLEVAALVVAFVDDGAAFDPTRMPTSTAFAHGGLPDAVTAAIDSTVLARSSRSGPSGYNTSPRARA